MNQRTARPTRSVQAVTDGSRGADAIDTAGRSHRRDLLSPSQLADRWGVTTGHLANLRHQGEGISYHKIGSRIAYRYSDVLAYENDHYVEVS